MVIDSIIGALKGVYHEIDIREPGGKLQGFDCLGSGGCYACTAGINAKYPYRLNIVGIKHINVIVLKVFVVVQSYGLIDNLLVVWQNMLVVQL